MAPPEWPPAGAAEAFEAVVRDLGGELGVERAMAFGKPGVKRAGHMCACVPDPTGVAFRLVEPGHAQALALEGAHLWVPSARDRPFKDWVYVPLAHAARWPDLLRQAAGAVR